MIIRKPSYMLISANSHHGRYLHQDFYPEWAALRGIAYAHLATGQGIEPHYHDGDEFWLFDSGRGEVLLAGQAHSFTPNTVVYMPKGLIHQFQCYTPGAAAGLLLRVKDQRRLGHLTVEEFGPPTQSAPGFVIEESNNTGPFVEQGPAQQMARCPVSELRMVTLPTHTPPQVTQLRANEYWYVTDGCIDLTIEGVTYTLAPDDVAILRAGVTRELHALDEARLILAHE